MYTINRMYWIPGNGVMTKCYSATPPFSSSKATLEIASDPADSAADDIYSRDFQERYPRTL